jgi:hypothetical protein
LKAHDLLKKVQITTILTNYTNGHTV